MKNALTIVLLFIIISLQAQEEIQSSGILIKTLPFQDAFYQNPNLIIEKPIYHKYSVSLLMALRYSDWISENSNIGKVPIKYDAEGWTLGGFFKYYYSKNNLKQSKPYVGTTVRYNDINIPDVELGYDTGPDYDRTVDLNRVSGEIGAIWGYQATMSRFVMDFYLGAGLQYRLSKEELVLGSTKHLRTSYTEILPRLYLGFSIGVKLF